MPAASRPPKTGNLILDHLPDEEFLPLAPMLQAVEFTAKQVIHQFQANIEAVYFPTTALASLLTILEEDAPVEAATVGKEGMVGVGVTLDLEASPHRVICQMTGECIRLPAPRFLEAIDRGPVLSRLARRYVGFSLRNTSQMLACNALHTIESRASRWLLMLHDQAGRDEFPMTQEFLAYMLGVRRQTVTVVAGTLQNAGLISYRRGIISVRDRSGLEEVSCECYATITESLRAVFR